MKTSYVTLCDVLELLDIQPVLINKISAGEFKFKDIIEFDNVSFAYKSRSEGAIRNLSIKIKLRL